MALGFVWGHLMGMGRDLLLAMGGVIIREDSLLQTSVLTGTTLRFMDRAVGGGYDSI